MRNWLFHPLLFYPLIILAAAAVIAFSIKPQSWPHDQAPVAGRIDHGALVIDGEGFTSPSKSPEQRLFVTRDFWGRAQSLHVAVIAGQSPPTPGEKGVRVLLTPPSAAMLSGHPVVLEITYRPQPVNTATALAVSLQGAGPAAWMTLPLQPQAGVLRYSLAAGRSINAIGLRAVSQQGDQAYGLEIVRITAIPVPAAPAN